MKGTLILPFLVIDRFLGTYSTLQPCNGSFSMMEYEFYLDYMHAIKKFTALDFGQCMLSCLKDGRCTSYNFCLYNNTCELNDVDKSSNPQSYGPKNGYIYGDRLKKAPLYRTCAEVKRLNPQAETGNYQVDTKTGKKKVYCDMENYDGGWTLVASISSSNRNHLQKREFNCAESVCVPYSNNNIAARKLSDTDIHHFASNEGTFRVDVYSNAPYTVFYQLPSGSKKFDSSCGGSGCPRMIISHHYPYQWESNCRGTSVGFRISENHYVFDGHDDLECGSHPYGGAYFHSSKYYSNRVLYGYIKSNGIYHNQQGLLYVK